MTTPSESPRPALGELARTATAVIEADALEDAYRARPAEDFDPDKYRRLCGAARAAFAAFENACTPESILQLVALATGGAEDTARIDWLEQRAKQDESVTLGWSRKDHDFDEWAGRSVVWPESFWVGDETAIDPPHPTLRPAIDAARSLTPERPADVD